MKHLKLFFALFAMLALGVGNAWGAENVTVTKTTNTLVSELGWSVSSGNTCAGCYTEFQLDEAITISTTGTPNCGSVWGTTTNDWRLYQNKSGNVIVSAKEGYELVSIKFTYTNSNYGTLKDGSTNKSSNTVVDCSGLKTKTLTVGSTSKNTNGQVRITAFSVTYVQTAGSGSSPVTPTQLTAPTGLTVDAITSSGATLSWNAVANASSYVVTIVDGESFEQDYPVNGTTTTVSDLESSTVYLWTVTAVGNGTNYIDSEESETSEFTTSAPAAGGEEPGSGTSGGDKYTKVTTLDDLEDGAYYVLYGVSGSYTGALKNTVSNGKAGLQAVTITEDAITNPDAAIVWRLNGNSSDGWTLYNEKESKYIEIKTNSTSGFSLNEFSSHTYTVTVSSEKGFFFKSNHTNAKSRGISIYRTDFRPYASNSANILYLFKKATETGGDEPGTEEPTWTISKDAIDFADKYVDVSYTETFTINASNLTDDIALAIDGSNFTVSPTSIATDAEFPQTVTVTYAPTAAGSHNATLNITSGSTLSKSIALTGSATEATIYTLTALADIKPTDKVIIVGTNASGNYAMSNDKGTEKAPAAVEVTVADNKIATNETNILWNIAKNGDNLTIYPADQTAKWLYCLANENNGVRVGSNTNKTFILDATSGYLQHTGTSRYLGIYDNSDWRCYTSYTTNNIKDQSFAFYVLPNTDPSISVTPASKDFGAVASGETATQEFEITALNITQALNAELTGEGFTKSEIVDNKITITFAPTEVKEYSATLTISAGTEASVSVTLEGEGVAATYSVTYDKNGAEGDAPTDETKYVADSKVTVAGQGDMTKAGYRFAGWKYGENIYKEGAKFNMPAEDVTFVAQWVEKQKFDAGYWVLVTDASELNADDYVVIAAADYDVAMKSYETGNNCKQVEVTKVNNLLTWNENVGVFQLDKSGENYTFQDVNTEQYLYAAGGTSNNYLRAADAIPTDENAKKYTWTISIADNKATIKAQIEDNGGNKARNTIMYNATEGVNGQLFSCYASGQKDIALYKYQTTYAYTRTVTNGNYGTICLPYASSNYTGMELYEVSWLKEETGLYLDQLAAGAQLEAGKPYIFRATSTEIEVTCTGDAVATPIAGENGLTGTFTDIAANTDLVGHYIIAQNKIWQANDQNTLPANRAYINATLVPTSEQPKLAGRRRVCMGENAATGLDNITNGENTTIKVIENGQLIIIRDGVKYNAQGQKL